MGRGHTALHQFHDPVHLTDAEWRATKLVAQALNNRQIAEALGIAEGSVKNVLREVYLKLNVWNRVELALWYVSRPTSEVPVSIPCPVKEEAASNA